MVLTTGLSTDINGAYDDIRKCILGYGMRCDLNSDKSMLTGPLNLIEDVIDETT